MKQPTFLIAGGGTSGHIYPALAIADQIRRDHPRAVISFCGTARGLESRLVPAAGYPFQPIRARGLPFRPSLDLIRALADFRAGKKQCIRLLRQLQPHAVVGTGGYVCSPVVAAAAHLNIPVLLHEQNAFPGRSNRLMARRSQAVCISFADSKACFRTKAPIVLTGNPVRETFFRQNRQDARRQLSIAADQPFVLALGGSLGARSINQAVLDLAEPFSRWPAEQAGRRPLVHLACGRQHAAAIMEAASGYDWLKVHDYIEAMDLMMAAADLVVCRSGAGACFELAATGRPAILVPYPHAAGDHQTANARSLTDAGAAILCPDDQLSGSWLAEQLLQLLGRPDRLEQMGQAAGRLARPQAAADICCCLYEIMKS